MLGLWIGERDKVLIQGYANNNNVLRNLQEFTVPDCAKPLIISQNFG